MKKRVYASSPDNSSSSGSDESESEEQIGPSLQQHRANIAQLLSKQPLPNEDEDSGDDVNYKPPPETADPDEDDEEGEADDEDQQFIDNQGAEADQLARGVVSQLMGKRYTS